MVKSLYIARHSKILGEDRFWNMSKPIGEQKRGVFRKGALVEDKKKLSTIRLSVFCLNGMGIASGKIPKITFRLVDRN